MKRDEKCQDGIGVESKHCSEMEQNSAFSLPSDSSSVMPASNRFVLDSLYQTPPLSLANMY